MKTNNQTNQTSGISSTFSKQFNVLFKYRTKEGKRLSRTAFDLLFAIITKAEQYGTTFYHKNKAFANLIDCSNRTIQRCSFDLQKEGFISIERQSGDQNLWTVNYKLIEDQIKLIQVEKLLCFDEKSEKEILQQEALEHADELKYTLDNIADEEMKECTSEAIDDIYMMQKDQVIYSKLEQNNYCEERIEQHQIDMNEIKEENELRKELINIAVSPAIELKQNILTPNQLKGIQQKFQKDLSDFFEYLKNGFDIYFEKIDDDPYKVGCIYVYRNNDPSQEKTRLHNFFKSDTF